MTSYQRAPARTAQAFAMACVVAIGAYGAGASAKVYQCGKTASDKQCAAGKSPAEVDEENAAALAKREADDVARDKQRADRTLVQKYPNAVAHRKAREAELEPARAAVERSKARIAQLATERKPLDLEAQFYERKELPPWLSRKIDANNAAVTAQVAAGQVARDNIDLINAKFDAQLARLQKLWAAQ